MGMGMVMGGGHAVRGGAGGGDQSSLGYHAVSEVATTAASQLWAWVALPHGVVLRVLRVAGDPVLRRTSYDHPPDNYHSSGP